MLEGQKIVPAIDRYAFRGEYLDCFAQIEHHLFKAISRAVDFGLAKKAPILFGKKFALVQKTVADDRFWLHQQHVASIMKDLAIYAEIRGLICHGLICDVQLHDIPFLTIDPPGETGWAKRILISVEEAATMLASLRKLKAKLLKQQLKPIDCVAPKALPNPPLRSCPASAKHLPSGTSAPSRS